MTPTTDEMRGIFIGHQIQTRIDADAVEASMAFDRWLNEVKAEAWEEGANAGYVDALTGREPLRNPYNLTSESFEV